MVCLNAFTEIFLEAVKDYSFDSEDLYIEKSKDNKNVIKLNYDGKFKYIGSRYYVDKDIENFLSNVNHINVDSYIIIFGLGTGEYILNLRDKIGDFNKILVIEPDERVLKTFLAFTYSKEIIEDDRIAIIMQKESIRDYLIGFINHESNYNNLIFTAYANYPTIYDKKYSKVLKEIKDVLQFYESNVITGKFLASSFMDTYLQNIKYIVKSQTVNNYKDRFKNHTAVLVSAGPSLEKNIEELEKIEDNAIIICGNRTLKPLLEKGITPHFMCSVDCNDAIYDMTKDYLYAKVPLVFTETSNSKLIKNQQGQRILFKYSALESNIENILDESVDTLYSGGSVVHACMDFAKYIGCTTIIFIGQDLAYTNNKSHASIAKADIDKINNQRVELFEIKGLIEEKVLTNRSLYEFKSAIEVYIKRNKEVLFVNSTEGGAFIEGTINMTLYESLSKYAINKGINKIFKSISFNDKERDHIHIKKNLENNLKEIVEIQHKIQEVRGIIKSSLEHTDIEVIKKNIDIIKEINHQLEENEYMNFIDFFVSDIINQGAIYFRYVESQNEEENAINLLKAFDNLYGDFIKAFEVFIPKIEYCIKTLI